MDREATSQPTLPQKIWGSTDAATNLTRSRSLASSNRNRPSSTVRPLATIYSRPESRADSRPESKGFSRPPSRSDQEKIERPKSGVRPLSGRVFMRRTSERGWIAKAYPDAGYRTTSQSELDIMDDLSDCDSFFDDDFDTETQGEKLGLLLSCNTLGVESKGRRPDWIAGEVGIPEFHCPRCRDHWYGISDLPCDEELARMKREGLWLQGREGNKRLNSYGGGKTLRPVSSHREYNTLSSESSSVKLPKIRRKKEDECESDKLRGISGESDSNKKKKKKRISFQLNEDSQPGSGGPSGANLDVDDLLGGRGRKSENDDSSKSGGHDRERGLDGYNLGKGGSDQMGASDGLAGQNGSGGQHGSWSHGEDGDKNRFGRKGQDGSRNGMGLLSSGDSNESSLLNGRSTKGTGVLKAGQNDGEDDYSGANSSKYNSHGYDGRNGLGRSGFEKSGKSSHDSAGMRSGHGIGGSGMENEKSTDGKNKSGDGGLDSASQVSRTGSKGSGSRRGSLGMSSDHGKNVRKGVGYMRAVSPTSSEWGDPHHGRSFISSTATSRTGSTSNLLRDLDKSKDEEPTSRSLPALVPQIKKKQPWMDFSDLMGGFQFTRAWTFSYHNRM